MNFDKQILDLASLAYEAASDPKVWSVFLNRLADAIDGDGTVLFAIEPEAPLNSIAALTRFDPFLIDRYIHEFPDNVWVQRADVRFKSGEVRYSQGLTSTHELLRDRYYADFLHPAQVAHSFGLKIPFGSSVPAYLASTRSSRKSPFEEREGKLLLALAPHLSRALALHRQIGSTMAFSSLLDALPYAITFTDQASRLLWWNRCADEIFRARDGLWVTSRGFRTTFPREGEKLNGLIRRASEHENKKLPGGGGMAISRPSQRRSYAILVSPVQRGAGPVSQAVAAVLITDPERRSFLGSEKRLELQFGFTPAEARVAATLMNGKTVESAADQLSITLATARTHVRKLLQKTGTARQTDMMRILLSAPCLVDAE